MRVHSVNKNQAVIDKYKQKFVDAKEEWDKEQEIPRKSYNVSKPSINWDEEWDGWIIAMAEKLVSKGFHLSVIARNKRIEVKHRKDLSLPEALDEILGVIGEYSSIPINKSRIQIRWIARPPAYY